MTHVILGIDFAKIVSAVDGALSSEKAGWQDPGVPPGNRLSQAPNSPTTR